MSRSLLGNRFTKAFLLLCIGLGIAWSVSKFFGFRTKPSFDHQKPLESAAIYDPDPNHLWNRLFVTFYRQPVALPTVPGGSKRKVHWLGPDVVDPPIGVHPRFLLEDEPFTRANLVLDEFLSQDGAKQINDPLKRIFLQRDLWAVFDVLRMTNSVETVQHQQHRLILEGKIARIIRSLALSQAQIAALPDTYSLALGSGAFSDRPGQDNFLPHDLFLTNSPWTEVGKSSNLLAHTVVAQGRSVFRTFVKSPANFTNVAADFIRKQEQWRLDTIAGHDLPHPDRLVPVET